MHDSCMLKAQSIFFHSLLWKKDPSHAVKTSRNNLKHYIVNRYTTLLQGRHIQRSKEGYRCLLTATFSSFSYNIVNLLIDIPNRASKKTHLIKIQFVSILSYLRLPGISYCLYILGHQQMQGLIKAVCSISCQRIMTQALFCTAFTNSR